MESCWTTPWTLMNEPSIFCLCKFHTAAGGNYCKYGGSCAFMHVRELHRPSMPEQATNLLQQLYSFASGMIQSQWPLWTIPSYTRPAQRLADRHSEAQPQNAKFTFDPCADPFQLSPPRSESFTEHKEVAFHDELKDRDSDETKEEPNSRSSTPSPSTLTADEKKHDTISTNRAPSIPTVQTPSNEMQFDEKRIEIDNDMGDFYKFVWSNSPQQLRKILFEEPLPDKYPDTLLGSNADCIIFEDAVLVNLKTEKYNGHPIRIDKFNVDKSRYQVTLVGDPDEDLEQLLIRRKNIEVIKQLDVSEAYQDFVDHLHDKPDLLQLLENDPTSGRIIGAFIDFQVPPIAQPQQIVETRAWNDIVYLVSTGCKSSNLSVSEQHSPQIISLLYSFCFYRETTFYLWKKYFIPSTWKVTEWSTCYGIRALTPPD